MPELVRRRSGGVISEYRTIPFGNGLLTLRAIPPGLWDVTLMGPDGAGSWVVDTNELQKTLDDIMLDLLAEQFEDDRPA